MDKDIQIKTRVTLRAAGEHEGHGFGRGIELLLLGVDKLGSLNAAAKELGMAYSKAWNILRMAEQEFGLELLRRDGPRGSTLTQQGRELLCLYQRMSSAAAAAALRVWEESK